MFAVLRVALLTTGVLFITLQAIAETIPTDTATLISYCAANFEACRNRVLTIDNMMRMGAGGTHKCSFPRTVATDGGSTLRADSIAATKAILDWLKANGATRLPNSDDAIEQAKKRFGLMDAGNDRHGLKNECGAPQGTRSPTKTWARQIVLHAFWKSHAAPVACHKHSPCIAFALPELALLCH